MYFAPLFFARAPLLFLFFVVKTQTLVVGSLIRPKIVTSVHYCTATKKVFTFVAE